jgi:addiction module HigA family antidote
MMKKPVHPGQLVRFDCIEALGLNIGKAAEVLGVTRPTLSRVINGRSSISPEMAIRLSKAFGGTAEIWLRMQMAYDLSRIREDANHIDIKPYRKPGGTSRVPPT